MLPYQMLNQILSINGINSGRVIILVHHTSHNIYIYMFFTIGKLKSPNIYIYMYISDYTRPVPPPPKINLSPKNGPFQKKGIVFQPLVLRGHVKFRGSNTSAWIKRYLINLQFPKIFRRRILILIWVCVTSMMHFFTLN